MNPKVSIIVLNWKTKKETLACIYSILKLDYKNFDVILVDNASKDGSVNFFREKIGSRVQIIENESNLGYCGGCNVGISYALDSNDTKYILVVNSDTRIHKNALSELVKVSESDSSIGFTSGKVYFFDRPEILQTVGKLKDNYHLIGRHIGGGELDVGQYDKVTERDYIDDVFMLIKSEVLHKIGLYDENFFMYREERDLQIRARKSGYRIFFVPKAKIWHRISHSSGGGATKLNTFYLTRNHFLLISKHGSPRQKFYFMLFFFINFPRRTLNLLIKDRDLLPSYLKGVFSGLNFFVVSN
jgi:hypothetical protein